MYNAEGELLDSMMVDGDMTDVAPAGAFPGALAMSGAGASGSSAMTITGTDLARIISSVAETVTRAVRDASQAQAQAHAAAFKELCHVTEIATQRLISLEGFVQQSLANRAADLEEREARAKETSEEETAVNTLMEHVAPKLADKLLGVRRRKLDDEPAEPTDDDDEPTETEHETDDDDDDEPSAAGAALNGANGAGRGAGKD